jgi:hypothetical protein
MSKEQALHNREATAKLLAATDTNLKGIAGCQLTPAHQSLRLETPLWSYVRQSRVASDAGDEPARKPWRPKRIFLSDELKNTSANSCSARRIYFHKRSLTAVVPDLILQPHGQCRQCGVVSRVSLA